MRHQGPEEGTVKRVLCAIDLSDQSLQLLKIAAAIEPGSAASLVVLHVVPTFDAVEMHRGGWFDPVSVVYAPPREEVLARVQQVVAAAGLANEHVSCRVKEGETAKTILEQAEALSADAIVLGTHEADDGARPRLGQVAERVLRHSRCDVLTVPPRRSSPARADVISTILCAVDFSPEALHAVTVASALADRVHAGVMLVHVIEWLADIGLADEVDFHAADFRARLVYNAQQRLDALVAGEASMGHAVRTRVAIGRPHRELLRIAEEEHVSLIVVGKQADRDMSLPFAGSTVEEVVRSAPCPVLTIHPARPDSCS